MRLARFRMTILVILVQGESLPEKAQVGKGAFTLKANSSDMEDTGQQVGPGENTVPGILSRPQGSVNLMEVRNVDRTPRTVF